MAPTLAVLGLFHLAKVGARDQLRKKLSGKLEGLVEYSSDLGRAQKVDHLV